MLAHPTTRRVLALGAALIDVPCHDDDRGRLVALDRGHGLPFVPARVFCITQCPSDAVRAEHAVSSHLALVAVRGSVTVDLDTGQRKQSVVLDRPNRVLCVHAGVWLRLHQWNEDCVLMVAASCDFRRAVYFDQPQPDLIAAAATHEDWT